MKCYNAAKKIVQTLSDSGFIAYFAGGWVRDHLLGKDADDIDIATNADPDQIMQLFPKTIPVGINFSILIVVEDEVHCEVATFRTESGYEDGRRPNKIIHSTPEEDAKRRDFTINGMFYDPIKDEVFDFVGGKDDLERKMIRAIGNPHERFKEDRLRMIRACRYSARFNFEIDEATKAAVITHATELFPAVAIERVYDEFRKMTREHHLFEAAILMYEFGLLQVIFKDFHLCDFETLKDHLRNLSKYPDETYPIIFLFEMCSNLSFDEKIKLCKKFKISSSEIKFTEELEKWHSSLSLTSSELVKLYAHPKASLCLKISSIHQKSDFESFHKQKQKELSSHIKRKIEKRPLVASKDLIKLGMKEGKSLGQMLKKAEELAINENLNSTKDVLARLQLENN